MALINRISRLFRADIHDILDRVEQPSVVLRQAVREMEEELGQDQHALRRLVREDERFESRFNEMENSLKEIEDQLDVCFQAEKEDLARSLIKRRLEMQYLQKQLSRKKGALAEAMNHKKMQFEENQVRLEEIRQKAELLVEENLDESFAEEVLPCSDTVVRDEDVEVAYLWEKQVRSRS